MNIKRILDQKGRGLITCTPDATVAEVANLLSTKRIGAIVILASNHTIAGIFSERDLARVVAEEGANALGEPVGRFMSSEVVTAGQDATVGDVMALMMSNKIRHLPIVDAEGAVPVGIVSIGDIVAANLAMAEWNRQLLSASSEPAPHEANVAVRASA